jgi:hypothetical protein
MIFLFLYLLFLLEVLLIGLLRLCLLIPLALAYLRRAIYVFLAWRVRFHSDCLLVLSYNNVGILILMVDADLIVVMKRWFIVFLEALHSEVNTIGFVYNATHPGIWDYWMDLFHLVL